MCCEKCNPALIESIKHPKVVSHPTRVRCTCPIAWGAIFPPPPCPMHGQADMIQVIC